MFELQSQTTDLMNMFYFYFQFCSAALQHSAAPVRVPAVRIIMSMYQQDGDALLNYLPPSDSALRKTFLYKTLFDGFAKMDGKLMETQARRVFFLLLILMNICRYSCLM